jgi:predicted ATPase
LLILLSIITRIRLIDQSCKPFLDIYGAKKRVQANLDFLNHQESYDMMNIKQRFIYDCIFNSIGMGGCYFLDGKAGRGKTFLVNAICNRIRGKGHIACITGLTALSVTLYERERTAHSMFGIPVQENSSDLVSRISIFFGRADVLRRAVLWRIRRSLSALTLCSDRLCVRISPLAIRPFSPWVTRLSSGGN